MAADISLTRRSENGERQHHSDNRLENEQPINSFRVVETSTA